MKPDIRTKLRALLDEGISSEKDVVYLLVELRKLLELDGEPEEFYALKFYADWATHPFLERVGARRIVGRFDEFERTGKGSPTPDLWDFMYLNRFGDQLASYLSRCELKTAIVEDYEQWLSFIHYFTHVIEDCPLRCHSKNFQLVNEVSVKVVRPYERGDLERGLWFKWTWNSRSLGKPREYECWIGLSEVPAGEPVPDER